MCGIAGLVTADGAPPDQAAIDTMAAALAHRGPDGRGDYRVGNVAMVQTRLAIIDLETGDQPIYEPGGAGLVANAEIYNYIELRDGLNGAEFHTASDCEPPAHLYRRDGAAYVDDLRGMYAIAVNDPSGGQLLLSRDPFGIKPLYYVERPDGLAFASEPQALIAAGLAERKLNAAARAELLQLQFTSGRQTPFDGIVRLLPGETLSVIGGRVVERSRRQALPEGGPADWRDEDALERLDAVLMRSVELHQRADVPYGMFLSGGIDSTALLVLMARLNDRPVRAFTAGFSDTDVPDERGHARAVARALGAEHIEVDFAESDFWRLLPEVAAALDDPAADYAVLPTYKLAAVAGQDLKVILSGEGGDELFGGYGRYRSVTRPWWQGGRMMRGRGILDGLHVLRSDAEFAGWRDGVSSREVTEDRDGRSSLQVAQAVDCADWLPNDLLIKLDRCLMAHGVEGRTPILDPGVADIAFRLPDRLKVRNGKGKWLLRHWLAEALPQSDPFSKKRGFTVPVAQWIHHRGRELGPLVAEQPGVAEICDPAAVSGLFRHRGKHQSFAAWTLLFYALWHRRHILGLELAGDVFESLATRH